MDFIVSIFLGLVQGITEFLPVSSTGHLILARLIFDVEGETSLAFDAILHLATALAVIVYFFDELFVLLQTILRKLGRLAVNEKDFTMVKALAIGTVPAIVAGILLEAYMDSLFRNPILVAIVLIVGSIFFMYAEYRYQRRSSTLVLDVKTGLKIGLFQILALIPGFSRAGATIAGGMILGISRAEAARFSFLLALPIILGAGGKKIFSLLASPMDVAWLPIGVGAFVAFIVALFAIHFMITFIKRHTLWPFIWYRITLACIVLFIAFF